MNNMLSREVQEKINNMVERVARKAGYTGKENMGYKEHLQNKYEQQYLQAKYEKQRDKFERKLNKYRHKISIKPSNTDFAEEIKTYLQDGLIDLMNEGYSEEEALKITMEKFDEADLKENFDEFVNAFEGFGMENYYEITDWYTKNGETIGLFYAAFLFLGMGLGALSGYLFGHTWLNTLIGFGAGLFIGLSLGLLSHGLLTLKRDKQH